MNIAIIPARGGSKRIPKKNIKLFYGKPMIAYSIGAALDSGCFEKVIVSTDDQEIAEVAQAYGAMVPFIRPVNIASDHATTMDVVQHAIQWCENANWCVNFACCIYATAPFVTATFLQQGLQKLQDESCEFVFAVTTFPFPIQRAIKLSNTGEVSMFAPENEKVRSQDLEQAYHDAGQFYWGKKEAFLLKKSIFSAHSRVVQLPRCCVQDIDTPEDWEFAEMLYKAFL